MLKQLRKDFTNVKDWPRFNGEGEYNHYDFIDWVAQTIEEQGMPDKLVTSKLSIVLTGIAREWYIEKRKETGPMPWSGWKSALEARFGTDQWRNNMEETFLKDKFNPAVHKDALVWALKQKKRIRAMTPDISSRKIV